MWDRLYDHEIVADFEINECSDAKARFKTKSISIYHFGMQDSKTSFKLSFEDLPLMYKLSVTKSIQ